MSHRIGCPPGLEDLLRAFVAEVATSSIRHQVRGKLSAVRNGAFYVRRKLEALTEVTAADPRLVGFLEMIDAEMAALGEGIVSRLPSPELAGMANADAVEVAQRLVRALALPSGISLQLQPAGVERVRAPPAELELALFCLVENAIDAVGDAGEVGIRVDGSQTGWVTIEVSDSGPGVQGQNLEALLEPFHSTKPGRMGVGLKIAQRIASRWGGEVEVGSADVALFPRGALNVEPRLLSRTRTRVLLVDDSPGPRITLAALLEDAGFEVVEAASLAEGRSRIADGEYALAVLDLNLTDGKGTALIPELLSRQPLARIAILSGSESELVEGIALFLTKSAAPDELVRQICGLVAS